MSSVSIEEFRCESVSKRFQYFHEIYRTHYLYFTVQYTPEIKQIPYLNSTSTEVGLEIRT